ncbi:class I SAM-dependent methyltransferase [Nakamurella sp. GG22]
MADTRVFDAYAARADEYAALFGSVDALHPDDREFVLQWADSVAGPLVDAGCGPGQWTALLNDVGIDAIGIDPTTSFVEMAHRNFPNATFRTGAFDDLGVKDGSLGGVLTWFSAWWWSAAELTRRLNGLGLIVTAIHSRRSADHRPLGAHIAQRRAM